MTQGIGESGYHGAVIETVRIVNVNIEAWSVDGVSEYGNKRFVDIQVMNPYFHYANGEGIYVMPEVGCLAWVCFPSSGEHAAPFIMGYQAPFDEDNASFRSGRMSLNPGDIMLRTRDENFVVLRRGGVVQIGATATAQRIYVPIRNFIRDFCENYELFTFGGEMTWITERDEKATDGAALTKYSLKAKSKANDEEHIATLTIGSHGEGDPLTLELTVFDSGDKGAAEMVKLQITKEGDVNWTVEKDWTTTIKGDYTILGEGNISLDAAKEGTFSAQKAVLIKSSQDAVTIDAMKNLLLKGGIDAVIDAPIIKLGGAGAIEPVVKGTQFLTFMAALIGQIAAIMQTVPPTLPTTAPSVAAMAGQLATLVSTKVFTA